MGKRMPHETSSATKENPQRQEAVAHKPPLFQSTSTVGHPLQHSSKAVAEHTPLSIITQERGAVSSWKLCRFWLAFTVLESTTNLTQLQTLGPTTATCLQDTLM